MIDTKLFGAGDLDEPASLLKEGKLVAFPTETVYGLGADAGNNKACQAVYKAKGRPQDNPFIIHLASVDQIDKSIAQLNSTIRHLFNVFSPGPLTIVMPKGSAISLTATASLDSVGIRIPSHPVAQAFLRKAECPVAAPSANRSGRPSPTNADMVMHELRGRIDAVIDGGPAMVGLESTVISCLDNKVTLLRAGGVSLERLQEVLAGEKIVLSEYVQHVQALSPGQKYRHYQPNCPVRLMDAGQWDWSYLMRHYNHEYIGFLSLETLPEKKPLGWHVYKFDSLEDYAVNLYKALVELDEQGCSFIIAALPPAEGIGRAIRDRLNRAAESHII